MQTRIELEAELTETMQKQRSRLLRLAQRRCRSREDAEDAVQEAYLSAYRHLDQFDGRAQLSSWLTRIVINAANDQLRRHATHAIVGISADLEPGTVHPEILHDAAPTPEESCARGEQRVQLQRLAARLPSAWRRALQLRAVDGLSTREAAQALGLTESTLKTHLFRAHHHLRRYQRLLGSAC
ncbi:MAG TPA: sigma-70 family RNA polymerase sigma factor [Terriglobales bacterium]|jgi:RNA polymerase sigma-70 factor (ECF subfamily)